MDRTGHWCRVECNSGDGMFFRLDQPEYGCYDRLRVQPAGRSTKTRRQFRDVASWVPAATVPGRATTRPLP